MAIRDLYPARRPGASPRDFFPITPADQDLPQIPQAIWVGGGGDLVLQGADGQAATFKNVPTGYLFIASPVRVLAATTATLLVGEV